MLKIKIGKTSFLEFWGTVVFRQIFLCFLIPSFLAAGTKAENKTPHRGQNLVAKAKKIPGLVQALIDGSDTVLLHFDRSGVGSNFRVRTSSGEEVPIESITQFKSTVRIKLQRNLDFKSNYRIHYGRHQAWLKLSRRFLNSNFSPLEAKLGSHLQADGSAIFRLWSPPATRIQIELFSKSDSGRSLGRREMLRGDKGLWTGQISPSDFQLEDFDGIFYQYIVTAYGQTKRALDPYAMSMAGFSRNASDRIGKAAVVNLQSPRAGSELQKPYLKNSDIMKNPTDMIAYEVHIRDFTIERGLINDTPPPAGTFSAFSEKIEHLQDLGITHVQLLPVLNFYTVNEFNKEYQRTEFDRINYNWGYDPHNYFTIEGWYSSNPNDPYSRIREFRSMVRKLHEKNIGVIVDVVYNHTYRTTVFENVCPGCYFRTDAKGNISSATRAGPTVESRNPMVRKLIIESLENLVQNYGINGFRFDLMGFMDTETLKQIRDKLGEDIVLYGEAWDWTDLPENEAVTKSNFPHGLQLSAFSDTIRDSVSGRLTEGGFSTGNPETMEALHSSIIGGLKKELYQDPDVTFAPKLYDRFSESPVEVLNYLSIHDGPTLWDKTNLALSMRGLNVSLEERMRRSKLAAAILMSSQGRVVLHGGVDIARSKPVADNDPVPDEVVPRPWEQVQNRVIGSDPDLPNRRRFHENSYKSSDFTNRMRWARKEDPNFMSLYQYYQNLIKLRRETQIFNMQTAKEVAASLDFIKPGSDKFGVVFRIKKPYKSFKSFVVLHNGKIHRQNFILAAKSQCLKVLLDASGMDLNGLESTDVIVGNNYILVPRLSTAVLGNICN